MKLGNNKKLPNKNREGYNLIRIMNTKIMRLGEKKEEYIIPVNTRIVKCYAKGNVYVKLFKENGVFVGVDEIRSDVIIYDKEGNSFKYYIRTDELTRRIFYQNKTKKV